MICVIRYNIKMKKMHEIQIYYGGGIRFYLVNYDHPSVCSWYSVVAGWCIWGWESESIFPQGAKKLLGIKR